MRHAFGSCLGQCPRYLRQYLGCCYTVQSTSGPIMIPKSLARVTTFISQNEAAFLYSVVQGNRIPVDHTEPSTSSSGWGSFQWLTQWCQRLAPFWAWDPWRRYAWWQIRLRTNTPTGGNTWEGSSPWIKQHHAITQLTAQKPWWRRIPLLGIPDEHPFTCGKTPWPHPYVLQPYSCRWRFARRIQQEMQELLLYATHWNSTCGQWEGPCFLLVHADLFFRLGQLEEQIRDEAQAHRLMRVGRHQIQDSHLPFMLSLQVSELTLSQNRVCSPSRDVTLQMQIAGTWSSTTITLDFVCQNLNLDLVLGTKFTQDTASFVLREIQIMYFSGYCEGFPWCFLIRIFSRWIERREENHMSSSFFSSTSNESFVHDRIQVVGGSHVENEPLPFVWNFNVAH